MNEGPENRIPEAPPISIALTDSVIPREDGPQFASISFEDAKELGKSGWEKIGVIVLVMNPAGEILTLTHGPGNPKVATGTKGLPSETLFIDKKGVEGTLPGISRLFKEELGLSEEEIASLQLTAVETGAWRPVSFPLGGGREALGLVVVLQADQKTADTMIKKNTGFVPTDEIRTAGFERAEPLAVNAPLTILFRKGSPGIVQVGLDDMTTPRTRVRIELPPPQEKPAIFTENLKDLIEP